MGFFSDYRATRRDERELGEGVWRRAHDRFKRGLDRYHQILESVRDPELRAAAVPVANDLADLLPRVRAVCMEAHVRAPSRSQDIPHSTDGYLSDVHRQLSRAGNSMAQAAEALTMARFAAGSHARPVASGLAGEGTPGLAGDGASGLAGEPGSGGDAAGSPEQLSAPSQGVSAIQRRSAVVTEYVTAAERLLGEHAEHSPED
ncbi:hypothetical protein AS25_01545 [Kocuria marina]|uniref:Dehydrogenase n=1 Tax=Kocuria marina TaxID=223184 RepID=A0A0B0DF37_9MICC|nr:MULTISPECIES: hypothetical protein [Kocuria]KHE75350.1 hypothetical protein AS25_01545 [Kocuria marina]